MKRPRSKNLLLYSFLKPKDKALLLLRNLFAIKLVRVILIGILVILLTPFIVFLFLKPKPQQNINYGVTFSKKYAEQMGLDWKYAYIATLDDLGAKNLRLVAYWDEIESTRDEYNYADIEWQLAEADKRNANVIMTIGRKVPRYPECFEPEWWKRLTDENVRDHELYEYIKTTTLKLKPYNSIKMWQVENEPFFPFGICTTIRKQTVQQEIGFVRSIDHRPVLIQDSGEGGFWRPSYELGDYLAISMYRKIWYDFWGIFFGKFLYFQYPLANWSYKIRADLVGVPYQKIIVTELQAEPWGPASNALLSQKDKDKTMSRQDFVETISYAQKTGFKDLYFWGVEWWLWEKEKNGNAYYWDTAKALFN